MQLIFKALFKSFGLKNCMNFAMNIFLAQFFVCLPCFFSEGLPMGLEGIFCIDLLQFIQLS